MPERSGSNNLLGGIVAVLVLILVVKFVIGMIFGTLKTILTIAFLAGLVAVVVWFYQQRRNPGGKPLEP